MACNFFKTTSECEQCSDSRCQINGGFINPAEMCGCDYCKGLYGENKANNSNSAGQKVLCGIYR